MGRRKWKLYQEALVPRAAAADSDSSDEEMPVETPALKIKTIEQINTTREDTTRLEEGVKTESPVRTETILESLIKRPATQPRLISEDWRPACPTHRRLTTQGEPQDWKAAERCYFCEGPAGAGAGAAVAAEAGAEAVGAASRGGASSPAASESDSSSESAGAPSPAAPAPAPPALLAHLLQLQTQNPQAIAQQFQQMMAALAALGGGLMPQAALSQALILQRIQQGHLLQQQHHVDRLSTEMGEKVSVSNSSPSFSGEQPLDLSARSGSSTGDPATPPPGDKGSRLPSVDPKLRMKRPASAAEGGPGCRRAYTEDELQSALRDIQSGRLGTRRAAVLYGIPRSTLRNKAEREPPPPAPDDDGAGIILKIPTFPPPERDDTPPPRAPDLPYPPLAFPAAHPAASAAGETLFSLRDVIAKSISQKFQQPGEAEARDRHVSVIKPLPERALYPHAARAPPNNGAPAGGKGTRPKRGKYRNYDRDSLVEAVKAVQRGEMSVHRAGSYYGVPHSTLEYKVKERHLMRPRKREPKPPPPDVKPPTKPPAPPAKPLAKPPFPNGINGPDALTSSPYPHAQPAYPFWSGASSSFPAFAPGGDFASHMMQRLRDESAPPQSNGSSFLEGIIRSSLDRPGALLQRLTEPPVAPFAKAPAAHLRRPSGEEERGEAGSPPARRPRLSSSDRQLAVEMREAVQRLRAAAAAGRNGAPTPPAPLAAPADRA